MITIYDSRNYQVLIDKGANIVEAVGSTIVEIIKSLQTRIRRNTFIYHLRQQKLSSPYRLGEHQRRHVASTIVEIIKSVQTTGNIVTLRQIYDSRNYQVRIDWENISDDMWHLRQQKLSSPYRHTNILQTGPAHLRQQKLSSPYRLLKLVTHLRLSTIVEIIKSVQTQPRVADKYSSTIVEIIKSVQTFVLSKCGCLIYDSRNYQVRIDVDCFLMWMAISTIVEIIKSVQTPQTSPLDCGIYDSRNYQVRIDTTTVCSQVHAIYDSRNYQVRIDAVNIVSECLKSTIVEIIKSVQTFFVLVPRFIDLRQQKLSSPYRQR